MAAGKRGFFKAAAWVVGVPAALIAVNALTDPPTAQPLGVAVTTTVPSTTTTSAPTTTVVVMSIPEQAPDPDLEAIHAATRVFLAGWLAPATEAERRAWLEPVTAPGLLPFVVPVPERGLPAGPGGDITVVSADDWRAVVRVPLPNAGVTLAIELANTADGWRVAKLDKV